MLVIDSRAVVASVIWREFHCEFRSRSKRLILSGATDAMARARRCDKHKCSHLRWTLVGLAAGFLPLLAGAQNSPADFRTLASQATTARLENDIPHAIQLYTQALLLNQEWKEGWWYLGLLQYEKDSYSDAQDALTRYIALDQDAGPAFALRGLCEFETGDYRASLEDIERGLSLGAANQLRNEQILRYHKALLLARLGRFQDALRAYAWFANKGITSPELMEQIGLAGLRISEMPKDAGEKQKSLFTAAGNAAFKYMEGHESEARALFRELFQQYPDAANTHLLYGYLLFERDPEEAVRQFKRELEVVPSSAGANIMLAWAYLMKNDPSAALPYAESAQQDQAPLPIAQLVLGRSLVGTGDVKNGIRYLERARQLDPGNLEVHIGLAEAYSKAGRKEDARRERIESLRLTSGETTPTANP